MLYIQGVVYSFVVHPRCCTSLVVHSRFCTNEVAPLGSTLTQGHVTPGQSELQYRPIIYHSRSLTKAEKGYGKIEGESLSVLAGIKVNSMYLYGTEFEVVNDQ